MTVHTKSQSKVQKDEIEAKNALDYIYKHFVRILAKLIELSVISAIRFAENFAKNAFRLLILFVFAVIAYGLREFFLDTENIAGIVFKAMFSGIDTVVNAIIDAVNEAGSDAMDVLTFGQDSDAVDIGKIDLEDESWITFLRNAKDTCDASNTIGDEVLFLTRRIGNNFLCPVARYNYPVPPIYNALTFLFYPFMFDPDPIPAPGCEVPTDTAVCGYANIYRLFEFLFYALFIWIVVKSCRGLLYYILIQGLWTYMCILFNDIHVAVDREISTLHETLLHRRKNTILSVSGNV